MSNGAHWRSSLPAPHCHWQLLGFELGSSSLLGGCSATWATPLALFWFSYFSDRISRFCPGCLQTTILLCLLHSWDHRQVSPPSPFVEMRVSLTFCPCWTGIVIILISTSQVAQIPSKLKIFRGQMYHPPPTKFTLHRVHVNDDKVFESKSPLTNFIFCSSHRWGTFLSLF
jgi:hypothetical protein